MNPPSNVSKTDQTNVERKKLRRLQSTDAAKIHRVYEIDEVCSLYSVSRNTPANWVKQGLQQIDARRDAAFKGSELNRFHKQRREAAMCKLGAAEIFCIACSQAKSPHPSAISINKSQNGTNTIKSVCPDCARPIHRFVNATDISQLRQALNLNTRLDPQH